MCQVLLYRIIGGFIVHRNITKFQLTRSRGAWHILLMLAASFKHFNSHAHVERDDHIAGFLRPKNQFQLTRSRGAWPLLYLYSTTIIHFNSHAHVERDLRRFLNEDVLEISTHTLTWSVTNTSSTSWNTLQFQLTRSRGAWLEKKLKSGNADDFNSHAHVERDVLRFEKYNLPYHFNSHAHVERDIFDIFSNAFEGISTHTLTWSVTEMLCSLLIVLNISTHTLTWSVTLK